MNPENANIFLWVAFFLSWAIAARWSAATVRSPRSAAQTLCMFLTVVGFFVMSVSFWVPVRFWALPWTWAWLAPALSGLGFAFCWWARVHLGKMWSVAITRKEGHRIIDTGPYAIVRHPIYTGLIFAAASLPLMRGDLLSIVGVAMWTAGFWLKASLEERFLRTELGAETYDAYARRVPMLVPFAPR